MNWYYESEGKPQGPVSDSLLRELLAEGKISHHTLVWSKGMPDWKPLWESFEPAAKPAGDGSPATIAGQPANDELSEISAKPSTPDWETSDSVWWFAFVDTVSAILSRPSETFRNLCLNGNWSRPLSFYILCSIIGSVALSLVLRIAPFESLASLIQVWQPNFVPPVPSEPQPVAMGSLLVASTLVTVLLTPFEALFSSLFLHGLIWLVGGAKKALSASFRVYCYAGGVGKILFLLQLAATTAASFWKDPVLTAAASLLSQILVMLATVLLVAFAMARTHAVSFARSVIGLILLPMTLAAGFFLLLRLFLPR